MPGMLSLVDGLNEQQREAVLHDDHTVVVAGPGSGKTATLVTKVAHLLDSDIDDPFAVACLTYNNDTVREIALRLRALGRNQGRRLLIGTVHSFCLGAVLRPFAHLVPELGRPDAGVLSGSSAGTLLDRALSSEGHNDSAFWFATRLSLIRKALALGESLDPFDERDVTVARRYEQLLVDAHAIDFDGMVFDALAIIESDAVIRDLLAARFPWLCVDEYQDLGGVLHRIVLALADAGVKIFAVGDADQTVYDFTGADPRYLRELQDDLRFEVVRLRFNYRSGARLIAAAQAALLPDEPRDYVAAPEVTDRGEVFIESISGGLVEQADRTAVIAKELIADGVRAHDIAILYPATEPILAMLTSALQDHGVPFVAERDDTFPRTPVVQWLQRCAQRALDRDGPDTEPFAELTRVYSQMLFDAGHDARGLQPRADLLQAVETPATLRTPLGTWIAAFDDRVSLRATLAAARATADDFDALDKLQASSATLGNFAAGVTVTDHVAVTTYHSSKGRQFDAVLLPGLQERLMPKSWRTTVGQQRRQFYVALTRAKRRVYLLSTPTCTWKAWGRPKGGSESRFVAEVRSRLAEGTG
jgi:DNA helicase-2/ATP-dependent DNA helicase PcrA